MAVLPRAARFAPGAAPCPPSFPRQFGVSPQSAGSAQCLCHYLRLLRSCFLFPNSPNQQLNNCSEHLGRESQTTKHCPWSCIFISRLFFEACNLLTPFKVSDCLSPVPAAWNEEASLLGGTPVALSDRLLHGNSPANQPRSPHGRLGRTRGQPLPAAAGGGGLAGCGSRSQRACGALPRLTNLRRPPAARWRP